MSRDVKFLEENFDRFEEEIKSKEAAQVDLKSIFPDLNEESERAPERLLLKSLQFQSMLNLQL